MKEPRIFIGPMSKNIVDTIVRYCEEENETIGIIPSRRQVESDGGYVNNWTTEEFSNYIKNKTNNVLLVRDHCGPSQGYTDDNGVESFKEDCKHFDVIHVDVWKKYQNYDDGLKATIDFISLGYELNPNLYFEVGTEESIRPFTPEELDSLLTDLKSNLSNKVYSRIKYAVIQSGTALQGNVNIGNYDNSRLLEMIKVVSEHGLISKEHNGDYLPKDLLYDKFRCGLDTINIAPEFGQIETKVILEHMHNNNPELIEEFYDLCYKSKRWEKWVPNGFIPENNKLEIINICGHYVFSNPKFLELKGKLSGDVDGEITNSLYGRIESLFSTSKLNYHDLLYKYFYHFSNKDIVGLSEMFSNDITLTDWDINVSGKKEVLKANLNIFSSVESISVVVKKIYENNDSYAVEIDITIDGSTVLEVVDVIKFDFSKIKSIKAYKG
jgi:hypothetical protein